MTKTLENLPHPQKERDAYFAAIFARFGAKARVADVIRTMRVVEDAVHQSRGAVEGSR